MEDPRIAEPETITQPPANRWLGFSVVLLIAVAVAVSVYAMRERSRANQLAAGYDQMSVALSQTRGQLETLTAKLNSMSTPTPAAQPAATQVGAQPPTAPTAQNHRSGARRKTAKRAPAEDPRWKQIQADLAEHQKQIEAARQDMEKTRVDLEGRLTSTREELSGGIARNHEELVALQKRGERNYYEFDLEKSKQFSRVGPLTLSLRKANHKQQYCDLKLIVDDAEITKKHVNLYEPVLFYPTDYAQALELVINHITKNQASGYVSVPKYKQSELAAASSMGSQSPPASNVPLASGGESPADANATADLPHRPTRQ